MVVTIDRLKHYYKPRDRGHEDMLPTELNWNEGVEDVPPGPVKPPGAPPGDGDDSDEEPGTPRWRPALPPRGGGVAPPVPPRPLRVLPQAVQPPARREAGDVYEAYGDHRPVGPAAARRTRIPGPRGARRPLRRSRPPSLPTIPQEQAEGGRLLEGRGNVTQRLQQYCDEPVRNISQESTPNLASPWSSAQASSSMQDSSDGDDEDEGDGDGARAAPVPLALRRLQDSAGWANAPAHRK